MLSFVNIQGCVKQDIMVGRLNLQRSVILSSFLNIA